MNFQKPGMPVRGSKSGAPIMALFDLLGRRWAMGIIWNLHEGDCTFRELQSRCEGLSPTLLNTRLKELRAARLVDRSSDGYCLTAQGQELYDMLEPMGLWAKTWASNINTDQAKD